MRKQKAFTLIELMVVIAIMGLLASIILVSLKGARERAKIAAAMQFASSLRAGLSDAIISWWSFDDGGGNIARDPWGGNNGTISGATWIENGIVRGALEFDGSNDYVEVADSSSLDITDGITVEAWIYPHTVPSIGHNYIVEKYHVWALTTGYSGSQSKGLFFVAIAGVGYYELSGVNVIPENQWTHFVGTRKGNVMEIYKNGKLNNSRTDVDTGNIADGGILYIGQYPDPGYQFDGIIDEVRIYNRSFTALEIQKRYVEGLKKFKLVEK